VSERAPAPDAEPTEQGGPEAPVAEPAEAAARATENVREALPPRRRPRRDTRLGTHDAERMIDLRTKGRTVREVAEEVGVSESTVRKRLREYTATGSIPIVKAR
jgi:DNA invertase Pin-like site-specific DNA recombinase